MSSTMRAKMRINGKQLLPQGDNVVYELLTLNAVSADTYDVDGADENNSYAQFTPSADLNILIANPKLVGKFELGEHYYVDFTPVIE